MNIYALSGLLIAITSGVMAVLMFVVGKNKLHTLWSIFCASVFVFGLGVFFVGISLTPENASFWWRVAHVGAIFIPALFLHFVYEFLEIKRDSFLYAIYLLSAFFLVTDWVDGLFIDNMRFVFGEFYYDSPPGTFYPLYTAVFFGLTAYSHYLLWRGYRETTDPLKKQRIKYFFTGMLVSFSGGIFNFFPVYGIDLYPALNLAVCLYPVIISYAILKHSLFDIKFILAEGAILLLNLFLFINIFTSQGSGIFALNIALFISGALFSIMLLRGVHKDVSDREKIEDLVRRMEEGNEHLRLMEEQKTEFISIASHQLRTPLTIIKGYTSMLLDKTFGDIPNQALAAIEKLHVASGELVDLVEGLLTVSRIERGKVVLNFETVHFKDFIQNILIEMNEGARALALDLEFGAEDGKDFLVSLDKNKIRQAVRHILENAIRSTPPKGVIRVFVMEDSITLKVRLIVSDTGSGLNNSQIKEFFEQESEHRDEDEEEVKLGAPGLELYIAREIIEAHHGVFTLESLGAGTGTTVVVEIPKKLDGFSVLNPRSPLGDDPYRKE